jgi:uncharacterized protein (TIGR03435 family)
MQDGFGRVFAVGLLLVAGAALGQTAAGNSSQAAPSNLAFVSATVKESAPPPVITTVQMLAMIKAGNWPPKRKVGAIEGAQVEYDSMSLQDLIILAYNVKPYRISGPGWLNEKQFDIVAKMPDGATRNDLPAMLQSLLKDRFKIEARREAKDEKVMALAVAKGGPKLLPATATPQPVPSVPANSSKLYNTMVDTPDGPIHIYATHQSAAISEKGNTTVVEASKITMAGFADLLTNLLEGNIGITTDDDWKVVEDRTGLAGEYQVDFVSSLMPSIVTSRIRYGSKPVVGGHILPSNILSAMARAKQYGFNDEPDVFNPTDTLVLQTILKLGLKMEESKGKVEMLIVDHAEKNPTAN